MNRVQAGKVVARVFSQRNEVQCLENGRRWAFAKSGGCQRARKGINGRKQESMGRGVDGRGQANVGSAGFTKFCEVYLKSNWEPLKQEYCRSNLH